MNVTRPRQELDAAHRGRLERAAEARRRSDAEMKAAVLAASEAGGSVRVIAEAGKLSTATVRDWIKNAPSD
jgi:transposase-like protein